MAQSLPYDLLPPDADPRRGRRVDPAVVADAAVLRVAADRIQATSRDRVSDLVGD